MRTYTIVVEPEEVVTNRVTVRASRQQDLAHARGGTVACPLCVWLLAFL